MAEQAEKMTTQTEQVPAEQRIVLIAMDKSDFSEYAFNWYFDNIHKDGDKLVLVHVPEYHSVIQSPMAMANVSVITSLMEEEENEIKKYLAKLGQMLKAKGVGGTVKSSSGNAGEVIVRVSKEVGANLIITGTRGLGKVRRTLMGSISDYILHHSHVPVLVCRHKDQKHHADHK